MAVLGLRSPLTAALSVGLLTLTLGGTLGGAVTAPAGATSVARPSGAPGRAHGQPHRRPTVRPLSPRQAQHALDVAEALSRPQRNARRLIRRTSATPPQRDASLVLRQLWRARPTLQGADRRAADRLLARPTDSGGDPLDPGFTFRLNPSGLHQQCSAHFCVHWTSTGTNAASAADAQATLDTMEHVDGVETGRLGMPGPVPDVPNGTDANPDTRVDVYLGDLQRHGLYGYCAPDDQTSTVQRQSGYCVLDSDFRGYGTTVTSARRVTAAHEFFHLLQFAFDTGEDPWFMEGTAVWAEDEVYNGINDYRQYVWSSPISNSRLPVDDSGANGARMYGSFTLFKYISARAHDPLAIRNLWARAAVPGVYSLSAVRQLLAARHWDQRRFWAGFGVWNTLVPGTYPERTSYGFTRWWQNATLTPSHRSAAPGAAWLDHTGSASMRVDPGAGLGSRQRLKVALDLPPAARGAVAELRVQRADGRRVTRVVPIGPKGNAVTYVDHFNRSATRYVVLVMANGSSDMVRCHSRQWMPTYACDGLGRYDDPYRVRVSLS